MQTICSSTPSALSSFTLPTGTLLYLQYNLFENCKARSILDLESSIIRTHTCVIANVRRNTLESRIVVLCYKEMFLITVPVTYTHTTQDMLLELTFRRYVSNIKLETAKATEIDLWQQLPNELKRVRNNNFTKKITLYRIYRHSFIHYLYVIVQVFARLGKISGRVLVEPWFVFWRDRR